MGDYLYNTAHGRIDTFQAEGEAVLRRAAEGTSFEGTLAEALVRAAKNARDNQDVPENTWMVVSHIEVKIGPNPPISQYRVILTEKGG